MNLYQFMSDSPFLSFFLLFLVLECVECLWKRFWSGLNIARHGWPPPHCDANGDFRKKNVED